MALCACGCGGEVKPGRTYLRGHNTRVALAQASNGGREAAAARKSEDIQLGEYGVHGTPIFAGQILEDPASKFQLLSQALKIYEEMRRTDGTVQAILLSLELPIIQAEWYLEPASQDPVDLKIAALLGWNLFQGMTVSWREVLRQALGMHWAGFSVFEKVFEPKYQDGEFFVGWRKLATRLQNTITRWDVDEAGGPRGLFQQKPVGGEVNIPIWKLLLFTNRKEGGNLQGLSFLRAAYKHWFIKDKLYRLWAITLERHAVGVPVMKLPKGANKTDKAVAQSIVTNLRKDESGGVTIPDTWDLQLLQSPGRDDLAQSFLAAIQHHDMAMAKAVLAQFLNLGEQGRGAYALAIPLNDLLTMAITAQADYVAEVITRYGFQQLVDVNWPGRTAPKLAHGDIRKKDLRQLSLILTALTSSGLLEPDPAVLRWVRQFYGLPEIPGSPLTPTIGPKPGLGEAPASGEAGPDAAPSPGATATAPTAQQAGLGPGPVDGPPWSDHAFDDARAALKQAEALLASARLDGPAGETAEAQSIAAAVSAAAGDDE